MRKSLILAALLAPQVQAQTLPPIRPLGATVARSTEPMGTVTTAVTLPGGKVLVNDILKRIPGRSASPQQTEQPANR